MMLTVLMTVSHLCQNLEIVKGVRSLYEGANNCDKRAKSLSRCPLPWFGGGDHCLVSVWEKADRLLRPRS